MPLNCDDCQQRVRWAVTAANSRWIALDPEPHPDGNQAAYKDEVGTYRTRQLGKGANPVGFERRYMPHIATCPAKRPPEPPPKNVTPITRAPSWRGTRPKGTT